MSFSLQHEIQTAQQNLQIPPQYFQEVSAYQTYLLSKCIEQYFVQGDGHLWWWEHWKVRTLHVEFVNRNLERFALIIPYPHEHLYVMFPTESPTLAYQGTLSDIVKVLWEIRGVDEFCIVSSKGEWLMYENHHDLSFFVGFLAMRYIKTYAYQHPMNIKNIYTGRLFKR